MSDNKSIETVVLDLDRYFGGKVKISNTESDKYQSAYSFTKKEEGGFVDNPKDKGGTTNKGVTQTVYTSWRLGQGLKDQSVRMITDEEADQIYRRDYWHGQLDLLHSCLSTAIFDARVNSGPGFVKIEGDTVSMPLIPLNKRDDMFKFSLSKISNLPALQQLGIALQVINLRERYIYRIVEEDPTQNVFLAGWLARINRLRGYCTLLAKGRIKTKEIKLSEMLDIEDEENTIEISELNEKVRALSPDKRRVLDKIFPGFTAMLPALGSIGLAISIIMTTWSLITKARKIAEKTGNPVATNAAKTAEDAIKASASTANAKKSWLSKTIRNFISKAKFTVPTTTGG